MPTRSKTAALGQTTASFRPAGARGDTGREKSQPNAFWHFKSMPLARRIALVTALAITFASILPGVAILLNSLQIVNKLEAEKTSFQLKVAQAHLEQRIQQLRDIPLSISRLYPLDQILNDSDAKTTPGGSGENSELLHLSQLLEAQILSLTYLREVSIISVSEGGREILRVQWHNGKTRTFQTRNLTTTNDIPLFINILNNDGGTPYVAGFEMMRPTPEFPNRHIQVRVGVALSATDGTVFGVLTAKIDVTQWLEQIAATVDRGPEFFIADHVGTLLFRSDIQDPTNLNLGNLQHIWPRSLEAETRAQNVEVSLQDDGYFLALRQLGFGAKNSKRKLYLATRKDNRLVFTSSRTMVLYASIFIILTAMAGAAVTGLLTLPVTRIMRLVKQVAQGKKNLATLSTAATNDESRFLVEAMEIMQMTVAEKDLQIRDSERRFSCAADAVKIGIWEWGENPKTPEIWTPLMGEILGYRESLNPEICRLEDFVHPLDRDKFRALRARYLSRQDRFETELRLRCSDGSFRYFTCSGKAADMGKGHLMKIVGTMIDIDEQKRAEKIKNDFVSTVSHELRTPMTSILGSVRLVNAEAFGPLPDKCRSLLSIAISNGERLLRLINDILDIQKMQSGAPALVVSSFKVRDLLQKAFDQNQPIALANNVEVLLEQENPDLRIEADFDKLIQVLTNLLSNGIKFSPSGSLVTLGTHAKGTSVKFTVTDMGSGIPKKFYDRVFQPFAQADTSDTKQTTGTGLGLSIAKSIAELHNGTIGFSSSENGSCFFVNLPVRQPKIVDPTPREHDAGTRRRNTTPEHDAGTRHRNTTPEHDAGTRRRIPPQKNPVRMADE